MPAKKEGLEGLVACALRTRARHRRVDGSGANPNPNPNPEPSALAREPGPGPDTNAGPTPDQIEWAKGIYIFGLFSKNAEKPPWYLNPLITFPSIFVIVGLGFYLVVALGGLHRGEVPWGSGWRWGG